MASTQISDKTTLMSQPVIIEKLTIKSRFAILGFWRRTKKLLRRYTNPTDRMLLEAQIIRLLNCICKNMQLYQCRNFIQFDLIRAINMLDADQLKAGILLANGLAERKIYPGVILAYSLPAVALASNTPDVFHSNLQALEKLAILLNRSDFSILRYGLPKIVEVIRGQQFTASITLAIQLAEQNEELASILIYALPSMAKLGTTPAHFDANLCSLYQVIINVRNDFYEFKQYLLPAVIYASATSDAFQSNMKAVEQLVIRKGQKEARGFYLALRECFQDVAQGSPTPEALQANLQSIGEFLTCLIEQGIYPPFILESVAKNGIPAMAKFGMSFKENLQAIEDLLISLVKHGINSSVILSQVMTFDLPAVTKVSPTLVDLKANLQAIEGFLIHLAEKMVKRNEITNVIMYGLPSVMKVSPTPIAFIENLRMLDRLIIHLLKQKIPCDIITDKILQQAIYFEKQDEDYVAILHPEISHTVPYEYWEYGAPGTYTVTDVPKWVELRPVSSL